MTRITPVYSVTMDTPTEEKECNLKSCEMKTDINIRNCLNDVPFKLARPLVITMSLFGLLHLSGKERRWAPITKIYSTLVLLLMWAMFIRLFTLYGSEGMGPVLIFKITIHSWTFLSSIAATSTYMACRNQNTVVEFLTRWSTLLKVNHGCDQRCEDVSLERYIKKTKLSFTSCLICSWIAILFGSGSFGYITFKTNLIDFLISPMDPNHPHALPLKCFLYVISIYMSASWVFTLCLFYNIGYVIYVEFSKFHKDFQKAVQPNGDIAVVGKYRRRHQEICLLVENADDILSGFSAVGILMSMVYGMLVLYNMIWYPSQDGDLVILLANIFWLFSGLLYMCVIAVGGGYLNHMAHSPLKTIHNIQPKTFSTEISLQMKMFLSKLTGESIGLTAMGMFVIDKPTILTIAGALLTYFVVLVQFQQPSDQQGASTNCTASIVL